MSRETCDTLFNCCNCGGHDCGCRYCYSCNACEACKAADGTPCEHLNPEP